MVLFYKCADMYLLASENNDDFDESLIKVVNVVSFETDAEAAKNAAAIAQEEMMKQVGQ